MNIPTDANPITDKRLTLVKVLSEFTRSEGRLDELKCAVKMRMSRAEARFAQSELVVAELRPYAPRKFVDPKKLYGLVLSKRITLAEFLAVLCVRSSLLPGILSGEEIDRISRADPTAQNDGGERLGALYTDFKPNVRVDFAKVEDAIVAAAGGK